MKHNFLKYRAVWKILSMFLTVIVVLNCKNPGEIAAVQQWTTHEITITSEKTYSNAYTDIDVWAQFTNEKEDTILRPAFWDGGNTWKVCFAPHELPFFWFNLVTGIIAQQGTTHKDGIFESPDRSPWVLMIGKRN